MGLELDEEKRYSRHIMLKEIGKLGQLKLKSAKVLLIGMGGLGSPVSLYLAAAGVGTLGLVDDDRVDISNLQRQILFDSNQVGQSKVKLAAKRLKQLNPHVKTQVFQERFSLDNARWLVSQFDVVVDASDNFVTRYLVNDACVFEKKPLVYGSIYRFEGYASVFDASLGPCYRCLFPSLPPEGLSPNCSELGVIGVLPGIIGTIQANEAIKHLLGIGDLLLGRLLTLDALAMRFREFTIEKNPACPLCGDHPTIESLRLETESGAILNSDIFELSPKEFLSWRKRGKAFFLLDVRERHEYELTNLGGYLIPISELPERLVELRRDMCLVVHCSAGNRSRKACQQLHEAGFKEVWNLTGGIASTFS